MNWLRKATGIPLTSNCVDTKKKTPPVTVGVFRRGENAPLRLALNLPNLSYRGVSLRQLRPALQYNTKPIGRNIQNTVVIFTRPKKILAETFVAVPAKIAHEPLACKDDATA